MINSMDPRCTIPSEFSEDQTGATSKTGRPKLLFLAWSFPPLRTIASVRSWNIAKYLSRLGWEMTVVTPEAALWRHVDSPKKTKTDLATEKIRQILTDHHWRFLNPVHL